MGKKTAKLAPLGSRPDLACRREEDAPTAPEVFLSIVGHQARLRMPDLVRMLTDNYLYQGLFTLRPRLYNQIFLIGYGSRGYNSGISVMRREGPSEGTGQEQGGTGPLAGRHP